MAVLESSVISATRTAASAALAASKLAPSARRVGFVGTGLIAAHVYDYLGVVGIEPERVLVTDHDRVRSARFAERIDGAEVVGGAEEVVRGTNLVVFATTAARVALVFASTCAAMARTSDSFAGPPRTCRHV